MYQTMRSKHQTIRCTAPIALRCKRPRVPPFEGIGLLQVQEKRCQSLVKIIPRQLIGFFTHNELLCLDGKFFVINRLRGWG